MRIGCKVIQKVLDFLPLNGVASILHFGERKYSTSEYPSIAYMSEWMDYWVGKSREDDRKNNQGEVQTEDPMEWRERGDCGGMKWLLLNRYTQDDLVSMILQHYSLFLYR